MSILEAEKSAVLPTTPSTPVRTIQAVYFNTWAEQLETAVSYLKRSNPEELKSRVARPQDAALLAKARLDRDWYAENLRCFASMRHAWVNFSDTHVCGTQGALQVVRLPRDVERWFIVMAHQPHAFGEAAGKLFAFLHRAGVRILYYAFDEASRFMPCFRDIAPSVDVLIHDELPLDPAGAAALPRDGVRIHRSWVANFVPFSVPFNEEPENKIVFLGSQLGLTPHRQRQIDFLQKRFKDRFVPSTDHSVSIADRGSLNRFKVGLCPEGRKFTTPEMSQSHTDRPFWAGCLGQVPVSENSIAGNRLDALAEAGLIVRYAHADLEGLAVACERALEMPNPQRRQIYEHFNRSETVGTVVAQAIAAFDAGSAPTPVQPRGE